jgi:hypothetical protein
MQEIVPHPSSITIVSSFYTKFYRNPVIFSLLLREILANTDIYNSMYRPKSP